MSATKKNLTCACLVTVGLILGYIESTFFPVIPLYGLKIGFSNLAVLVALFAFGAKYALGVGLLKAVLSGFLFSGAMSIFYGAVGISFAVLGMCMLMKTGKCSILGISVLGSSLFQVGQIAVACCFLQSSAPLFYLSYLLIGSVPCGLLCGGIAWLIGRKTRLLKEFIYEKKDEC